MAATEELNGQLLQVKIWFSHSEASEFNKLHIGEIYFSQPPGVPRALTAIHDLDCSRPLPSLHELLHIRAVFTTTSPLVFPPQAPISCESFLVPYFFRNTFAMVPLTPPTFLWPGLYKVEISVFASTGLIARTESLPAYLIRDHLGMPMCI